MKPVNAIDTFPPPTWQALTAADLRAAYWRAKEARDRVVAVRSKIPAPAAAMPWKAPAATVSKPRTGRAHEPPSSAGTRRLIRRLSRMEQASERKRSGLALDLRFAEKALIDAEKRREQRKARRQEQRA